MADLSKSIQGLVRSIVKTYEHEAYPAGEQRAALLNELYQAEGIRLLVEPVAERVEKCRNIVQVRCQICSSQNKKEKLIIQ